jgi:hypothetical protein
MHIPAAVAQDLQFRLRLLLVVAVGLITQVITQLVLVVKVAVIGLVVLVLKILEEQLLI